MSATKVRRLILMRHAKSAWDAGSPTDHARPLNHRGRRDAPRVARRLVDLGWQPDCVISSTSERTRETWGLMRPEFEQAVRVDFADAFYHGGAEELAAALTLVDDELHTVLALGHNPGWQEAVYGLSGEHVSLTTANAALLQMDEPNWRKAIAASGNWQLIDVVRPKEL